MIKEMEIKMEIKKVTAVYFSPTHGTEKYVKAITEGICADYEVIDLTKKTVRANEYNFGSDEVVVLGVPVYGGRVPEIAGGLLEKLHGDQTPVVLNAVYGNREIDDALLEMNDLCVAGGFTPVAGASWLAEHTYTDKCAGGRPTADDLQEAKIFGADVKELLQKPLGKLIVPGNPEYKPRKAAAFHPAVNDKCNSCGLCADVCPTGAITLDDPKVTNDDLCINCLACVKNCPNEGRGVTGEKYDFVKGWLEENFGGIEKSAVKYFAE